MFERQIKAEGLGMGAELVCSDQYKEKTSFLLGSR
jgi:hypothetical protein